MISKPALPLLALLLSACAAKPTRRSRSRRWPSSASARPTRCRPRRCSSRRQDRLPDADALTATEQAIQLDELIKWVEAQAAVDNADAD